MIVTLSYRNHGVHTDVKQASIPGRFADYCLSPYEREGVSNPSLVIAEGLILARLPPGFFPVRACEVLLLVEDLDGQGATAVGKPSIFRRWGKYFPAYSITCKRGKSRSKGTRKKAKG